MAAKKEATGTTNLNLATLDVTPGERVEAAKPYDTPIMKVIKTEIPVTSASGRAPIVREDYR